MATKKKLTGLGRGLSALMRDDMPPIAARETPASVRPDQVLPIEYVERNTKQPRRSFDQEALVELSQSIRENGILQPILVRRISDKRYEIIAGERRWRAAQLAGLHEVPVSIKDVSDEKSLELAIIENIQRKDLTPIEEALSYKRLMLDFNHTQEALSGVVGKSRSHVANLMRLLSLPEPIQKMVDGGILSMGHARALIGATNAEELAKKIVSAGLSVRQVEALVSKDKPNHLKGGTKSVKKKKDADTVALEKDIKAALGGMAVSIEHAGPGGSVIIKYGDLEDLDTICSKLGVCGI